MRGPVSKVLFGQEQQSFAVHLKGAALNGPQGKFLLCPPEPLGHIFPAPVNWLQTWAEREHSSVTKLRHRNTGRHQNPPFLPTAQPTESQGKGQESNAMLVQDYSKHWAAKYFGTLVYL